MRTIGRTYPSWPVTEALARAVEEKRKDMGLTQEGLARRVRSDFGLTCTNEAISNLVTQKAKASTLVEPVCEILGLNLLELVAMDERQKKLLRALAALEAAKLPDDEIDRFVREAETRSEWLAPPTAVQVPTTPARPGPVRSRGSTDKQ